MAASARTDAAREDFVIERTFDIPRALMWKMWTDPAHLSRWWGPKGFTVSHCTVDLRPGGIVGNGGRESACGWCKDKWGISWQIAPRALTEAMAAGGDEAKRAFQAMMTMTKIDVAAIEAARRG